MLICGIYYVFWIYVLPRWKGYVIRAEVLDVDGGSANTHRLVRVPVAEAAQWDAAHDDAGRLRSGSSGSDAGGGEPKDWPKA